ncbi:diguanylate cyclase [Carboxydothermus ferrireducens]|uniref:Diguanylate cyclase (GGDEF)-like protein/putative nucleotidyltransferase with HDIG domain n=1 Tax=Carboxydothermus ferrireducens DSM 11255 TaxID=1119529 RepID=A0ABX2RC48_9THEO|nr:diguanylate cyclase [Carboxydothermus ferrireducens]NYE58739.1 diguanylate cyclase (GGDEF)-like protein/putative nucleotidyltransferase with HDIG domain [Carboxydothermus ferrireducens DSM 11255]
MLNPLPAYIRVNNLKNPLQKVNEFHQLLAKFKDPDDILREVCFYLKDLWQALGCNIVIPKNPKYEFELKSHYSSAAKPLPENINENQGLSIYVFKEKHPVLINDTTTSPLTNKEIVNYYGHKSAIAAPMVGKSKTLGVIIVFHKEKDFFTIEDLELLTFFANHTAYVIENLQLLYRLEKGIYQDFLTGVYNYRYLQECLLKIAEDQTKLPLSVIMIDLDNFKKFNDMFGHRAGDQIIKTTAKIIKSSVRKNDLVFRYGGDEFAVLLPATDYQTALNVAQRISEKIKQYTYVIGKNRFRGFIRASVGASTLGIAPTPQMVLDLADKAMYQIKRSRFNILNHFAIEDEILSDFNQAEKTLFKTLKVLLSLIDFKDHYTLEHSRQVSILSYHVAKNLNLEQESLKIIYLAGLLHDVGKIWIDEAIINKPGPLNLLESGAIKKHPVIGAEILEPISFLKPLIPIIYHHHEKYDGSGYPDGLSGKNIPLLARIITLADSFDAMTSTRPYREPLNFKEAILEIKKCSGSHFDPDLLDVFIKTLYQLKSETTEIFS